MAHGTTSGIVPETHPKKNKRGKSVLITAIVLLAAMLIGVIILVLLLVQDNVSHKYSATPNLDALTKAVVELGANNELTLTPQEMTDTVGYFLKNGGSKGEISNQEIYFDVAEDGESAFIVAPFEYMGTRLILQMTASMGLREVSEEERYFTFTVTQTKIGELVIPQSLVDSQIKKMKFPDLMSYNEGVFSIDSSFFSLDILGKKTTFKVLELSVVPEGFHVRTESLNDFLGDILSEHFKVE